MSNVVTIDGPTSSGKSSVGLLFSQKIGYQFIDTGRIYRAGALYIMRNGIPLDNEEKVAEVFKNLKIEFKEIIGKVKLYLQGEDITALIHSPEITFIVPKIAAHAKAREFAKQLQRRIGAEKDTVMAGRDIGSEIFPDSKLKFFITADVKIRAQRRYDQIKKTDPNINFEDILRGMADRDNKDSTREASPMRIPPDAVVIDTSNLTTEETVEKMLTEYRRIFSK
ncbi:MAG TPA: (d)CMP kinase [Patescibacteria group bacterium]|nr:(d)CMP kinase [Patescibacteria group bacterium]